MKLNTVDALVYLLMIHLPCHIILTLSIIS